ncbi:SIR2 family protein [uncultured Anaeromusa sp.]|uniref:SIR2 family protein n=1 Tax=uncultured Anaeromusa sp. TaxID=673273 RepID=UPI0029C611FB|nr:SIR2 family protein [uncultured Anaeromusa sp.]
MNKETLIDRVAEALKSECGAIFVGSGISHKSTKVDWFKLLEPSTRELDITIDNENDDLPLIAQYLVNQSSGNRGPLINQISKAFNKKFFINEYHKVLSTMKLSTIWTTNYDMLLEEAFLEFLVDVKVNDDSMSRNLNGSKVEIIKMHGCISRSHHDEITITQEDYEDFLVKKPAISQRLCNDLLKKSFLFIGYSCRDPNIKNIMVLARRLCKKSTQEHYLILKKVTDGAKCKEKARRQELWCNDLKRFGISTLLIDEYDELEDILVSISQRSRGKTVYITGSHEGKNFEGLEIARTLGGELAKTEEIILFSGQSSGIGANVVSAFTEQCILNKIDVNCRMRIFPNPYAANPKFSNDFSLLPELKKYRAKLLNSTQVLVVFSGGKGTEAEVEVALNRNCKIIPAITRIEDYQNDVMIQIISNESIMENIKMADGEYYNKIVRNVCMSSEDIYNCVMKLIK